jgi:hopene-associated glycosyltransferase HpnB
MDALLLILALLSSVSVLAWAYLIVGRGQFWRTDQRLPESVPLMGRGSRWPRVAVVVPARNEAEVLPDTLPALLRQDYPGPCRVFLVDDRSSDGTGDAARRLAREMDCEERLTVVEGAPLPEGWSGKVWAMQQGVQASSGMQAGFVLFTDADIWHPQDSVRRLVNKAMSEQLDMASLMVRLRVSTFWERLLIPAFVYFFAKLYPFCWVNNRRKPAAAAAGGCILVSRSSLERSGGLEAIADALIDDCSLAHRIKRHTRARACPKPVEGEGRIWIGLTQELRSIRPYDALSPIWNMVSRTAYAQLGFSPLMLASTVLAMLALYLVPPASALCGVSLIVLQIDNVTQTGNAAQIDFVGVWLAVTGLIAWAMMSTSYLPMLRWHGTPRLFAPLLPVIGVLYTLMTVDSALRWHRGKGGAWKGRTYGVVSGQ